MWTPSWTGCGSPTWPGDAGAAEAGGDVAAAEPDARGALAAYAIAAAAPTTTRPATISSHGTGPLHQFPRRRAAAERAGPGLDRFCPGRRSAIDAQGYRRGEQRDLHRCGRPSRCAPSPRAYRRGMRGRSAALCNEESHHMASTTGDVRGTYGNPADTMPMVQDGWLLFSALMVLFAGLWN